MKNKKLFQKITSHSKNISFNNAVQFIEMFGFQLDRISGSHHIFKHPHVTELINIQNVKGKAKPYQIKQFLEIIERYNLPMEESE